MPNIKPISDLRNYTKVVEEVKYGERVYLIRNGHGCVAMINMQELDDIERELALYKLKGEFGKAEQSIIDEGLVSEEDPRSELGAF